MFTSHHSVPHSRRRLPAPVMMKMHRRGEVASVNDARTVTVPSEPTRQAPSPKVATWAEFANAEPNLAAFARTRIEGRIVYQATLRPDGGPRVHPVSPRSPPGSSAFLSVTRARRSARWRTTARYALHAAQRWEDHAGGYGEFSAPGSLEQIPSSHPAVLARPSQTAYGLVHYACSIDEAGATEHTPDEMPVYRRWKPPTSRASG
jgi:hypothetical protein